jgi:hypothetical protein
LSKGSSKGASGKTRSLGFDTLSAEFILSLPKGYELLNRRSLAST